MAFPIATTALTIVDYAIQSNDEAIQNIVLSIIDNGSVLEDIPLVTNAALKVDVRRMTGADLPATGWGRLNQVPTDIKTTVRSYEEGVALIRERIQVDRRLLAQKNWIDDPIDTQVKGAMAAHTYDMNDAFFHNDPSDTTNGNPDAWVGLRTRIKNPKLYGVQLNAAGTAAATDIDGYNGGTAVNLTVSMAAADAQNFFEAIAQALAFLGAPDGRGCVAYTNWLVKERWARAIRLMNGGGGFDTTVDNFGRQVDKWRQMRVRDIGFKKDQTTTLISNTLNTAGDEGASTYSELYIVRYGPGHFKGWQTNDLKPEYLGRSTEYGTYENIVLDWGCGLYYPNSRSFARVKRLQIA